MIKLPPATVFGKRCNHIYFNRHSMKRPLLQVPTAIVDSEHTPPLRVWAVKALDENPPATGIDSVGG